MMGRVMNLNQQYAGFLNASVKSWGKESIECNIMLKWPEEAFLQKRSKLIRYFDWELQHWKGRTPQVEPLEASLILIWRVACPGGSAT